MLKVISGSTCVQSARVTVFKKGKGKKRTDRLSLTQHSSSKDKPNQNKENKLTHGHVFDEPTHGNTARIGRSFTARQDVLHISALVPVIVQAHVKQGIVTKPCRGVIGIATPRITVTMNVAFLFFIVEATAKKQGKRRYKRGISERKSDNNSVNSVYMASELHTNWYCRQGPRHRNRWPHNFRCRRWIGDHVPNNTW